MFSLLANFLFGIIQAVIDLIGEGVLTAIGTDASSFEHYFPAAAGLEDVIKWIGFGISIALFLMFLLKVIISPMQSSEIKTNMFMATLQFIFFACLSFWGYAIADWIMEQFSEIYQACIGFDFFKNISGGHNIAGTALSVGGSVSTLVGAVAGGVVGLADDVFLGVEIILMLILGYNYIKLIFQMVERYVMVCFSKYLSPIALANGASPDTFRTVGLWFKSMFGGMLLLLLDALGWRILMSANTATTADAVFSMIFSVMLCNVLNSLESILNNLGFNLVPTKHDLLDEIAVTGKTMMNFASNIAGKGGAAAASGGARGGFVPYAVGMRNINNPRNSSGFTTKGAMQTAGTGVGLGLFGKSANDVTKALGKQYNNTMGSPSRAVFSEFGKKGLWAAFGVKGTVTGAKEDKNSTVSNAAGFINKMSNPMAGNKAASISKDEMDAYSRMSGVNFGKLGSNGLQYDEKSKMWFGRDEKGNQLVFGQGDDVMRMCNNASGWGINAKAYDIGDGLCSMSVPQGYDVGNVIKSMGAAEGIKAGESMDRNVAAALTGNTNIASAYNLSNDNSHAILAFDGSGRGTIYGNAGEMDKIIQDAGYNPKLFTQMPADPETGACRAVINPNIKDEDTLGIVSDHLGVLYSPNADRDMYADAVRDTTAYNVAFGTDSKQADLLDNGSILESYGGGKYAIATYDSENNSWERQSFEKKGSFSDVKNKVNIENDFSEKINSTEQVGFTVPQSYLNSLTDGKIGGTYDGAGDVAITVHPNRDIVSANNVVDANGGKYEVLIGRNGADPNDDPDCSAKIDQARRNGNKVEAKTIDGMTTIVVRVQDDEVEGKKRKKI